MKSKEFIIKHYIRRWKITSAENKNKNEVDKKNE